MDNHAKNFKIQVRMLAANNSADIYMDLATANAELNDNKKQRRAEVRGL